MVEAGVGLTCPDCREKGVDSIVKEEWQHAGTESYLSAECTVCEWKGRYGPI